MVFEGYEGETALKFITSQRTVVEDRIPKDKDLITDWLGDCPTPELDRTEHPEFRVARTFAVIYPEARRPPRTARPLSCSLPLPRHDFQSIDKTCDNTRICAHPFPRAMATPPPRKRVSQACRPCGVKKIKVRESAAVALAETNILLQCDGAYPTCSPCQSKAIECSYGTSKRR